MISADIPEFDFTMCLPSSEHAQRVTRAIEVVGSSGTYWPQRTWPGWDDASEAELYRVAFPNGAAEHLDVETRRLALGMWSAIGTTEDRLHERPLSYLEVTAPSISRALRFRNQQADADIVELATLVVEIVAACGMDDYTFQFMMVHQEPDRVRLDAGAAHCPRRQEDKRFHFVDDWIGARGWEHRPQSAPLDTAPG